MKKTGDKFFDMPILTFDPKNFSKELMSAKSGSIFVMGDNHFLHIKKDTPQPSKQGEKEWSQ